MDPRSLLLSMTLFWLMGTLTTLIQPTRRRLIAVFALVTILFVAFAAWAFYIITLPVNGPPERFGLPPIVLVPLLFLCCEGPLVTLFRWRLKQLARRASSDATQ